MLKEKSHGKVSGMIYLFELLWPSKIGRDWNNKPLNVQMYFLLRKIISFFSCSDIPQNIKKGFHFYIHDFVWIM